MDYLALTIRSQAEVLADIQGELDDISTRWTDAQIYGGINRALDEWHRRVFVPFIYELPTGFANQTDTYALPDYIQGRIVPQQLIPVHMSWYPTGEETDHVWNDVDFFSIDPVSDGSRVLRLHFNPRTVDARILWYAPHGKVPTALPVTSAGISASDTEVTLTTKPAVGLNGYVRFGTSQDWASYNGLTRTLTTMTLTNLTRGLNGTTAATVGSGATVTWGIAVPRADLFNHMQHRALAYLYSLKLGNAAPTERENYYSQMLYYEQKAKEYWRTYTPPLAPKMRLVRQTAEMF